MSGSTRDEGAVASRWAEIRSPIYWDDGRVMMLDQRLLPGEERWVGFDDAESVAGAIRDMVIRGAPAIGCAAAFGLAAGARGMPDDAAGFSVAFAAAAERMAESRPTAVNLFWAIDRQKRTCAAALADGGVDGARAALEAEALAIWREDVGFCKAIGRHGAALIADGSQVLTHCNAGALATGGYGTALGVIRGAVEAGKRIGVFADETRPYLQGARLTAWELSREGIDVTLICDNMAGALMQAGEIGSVVVGADRIAANGDVANKIGTYSLAVLARHHGLPFYVAAPRSTIDLSVADGAAIPIEQRAAREVTHVGDTAIAPEGIKVAYPAFDVTPAALVTAVITEVGVAQPVDEASIAAFFDDTAAG